MLALPRQNTQEMKLKWSQIRLLHRILATNIVIKEMDITQSVLCDFCHLERDSLQHCMWGCEHNYEIFLERIRKVHTSKLRKCP